MKAEELTKIAEIGYARIYPDPSYRALAKMVLIQAEHDSHLRSQRSDVIEFIKSDSFDFWFQLAYPELDVGQARKSWLARLEEKMKFKAQQIVLLSSVKKVSPCPNDFVEFFIEEESRYGAPVLVIKGPAGEERIVLWESQTEALEP